MKLRLLPFRAKGFLATLLICMSVQASGQYCAPPTTVLVSDDPLNAITNVTIQGTSFDHSTTSVTPNGYVLVPASTGTASLTTGATYSFSVSYDDGDSDGIGLWIDYDQDQQFSASEFTEVTVGNSGNTVVSVTIPQTALAGTTQMRLTSSDAFEPSGNDACADHEDGEVEDYVITIVAGSALCTAPDSIIVGNITSNTAAISWPPVSTVIDYEYAVTTSQTPPVSGTSITATSVTVNSLVPAMNYYVFVRSVCDSSNFSQWAIDSFTTPGATHVNHTLGNETSMVVYPNPAGEYIHVRTVSGHGKLDIMDYAGKVSISIPVTKSETTIDVSRMAAGLYFIRYTGGGKAFLKKLWID